MDTVRVLAADAVPEFHHTKGVEMTTGPLGQGLSSAVGMAMATRRERGPFDPDAAPGESPFDHFIYVVASDDDIEEGVTPEASSIAGRQELGNLIVFYDHNEISIEDDTNIELSEDVAARYEAYGWHVQKVEGGQNIVGILESIWGSTRRSRSRSMTRHQAHQARVGPRSSGKGRVGEALWRVGGVHPGEQGAVRQARRPELPAGWTEALLSLPVEPKGVSTRAASGSVLNALAPVLPELWGGSADLAESNSTTMKGANSFGSEDCPTHQPVEHLAAFAGHPGLAIARPADGNETAYAWQATLDKQSEFSSGPVGLALTRQHVPTLDGTTAEGVSRGGYVLADADGDLQVVIMASGSEVQLAVKARELCRPKALVPGWFRCPAWTSSKCRAPPTHRVRAARCGHRAVSVEAGIAQPWWRWLGSAGKPVSLEHYGASGDAATLFREFGFTPEATVAAAEASLAAGKPASISTALNTAFLQHVGAETGTATESGTQND